MEPTLSTITAEYCIAQQYENAKKHTFNIQEWMRNVEKNPTTSSMISYVYVAQALLLDPQLDVSENNAWQMHTSQKLEQYQHTLKKKPLAETAHAWASENTYWIEQLSRKHPSALKNIWEIYIPQDFRIIQQIDDRLNDDTKKILQRAWANTYAQDAYIERYIPYMEEYHRTMRFGDILPAEMSVMACLTNEWYLYTQQHQDVIQRYRSEWPEFEWVLYYRTLLNKNTFEKTPLNPPTVPIQQPRIEFMFLLLAAHDLQRHHTARHIMNLWIEHYPQEMHSVKNAMQQVAQEKMLREDLSMPYSIKEYIRQVVHIANTLNKTTNALEWDQDEYAVV